MKPIFTILSLYSLLHSVIVYAEVGTVHTMREFSYRNEAEESQAEEIALKMLRSTYDYFPDVENCYAGSVTSDQKRRVLKELNAIRRAHGLEEVKYDASKDRATAASALISVANGKLDHYPNSRMKCYSQEGYNGSSQSNLHLSQDSLIFVRDDFAEQVIDRLVIDDNVYSLGHRLWFLDPFLGDISYGRSTKIDRNKRVLDAATIYIGNQRKSAVNTKADYVAYPYKNYKANWFSVIVDKNESYFNRTLVDFSRAEIKVSSADGRTLKVSEVTYSTRQSNSAGLGNVLGVLAEHGITSVITLK